jgi:hypothetical protein
MVSACSSTDRMAAPVVGEVVSDQVTESDVEVALEPDTAVAGDQDADLEVDANADAEGTTAELDGAAEGTRVQAFVRGVRVCVINERTTRDGKPAWINVKFSKADRVSRGNSYVAPGDQICGEAGYEANLVSVGDLLGSISTMYDSTTTANLSAVNHAVGEASMDIVMPKTAESRRWYCSISRENTSEVVDDTINRFTLKRLPDSASFKEFTVTVSDGQSRELCLSNSW